MSRKVLVAAGIAVVAAGVVLVFSPGWVADALGREPHTSSDRINLRASWGGTVAGLGLFLMWLPWPRPRWWRVVVGLLGCAMAGIGAARAVGFALDGGPDGRQYVWLIAEIGLVVACALVLRRRMPT